MEFNSGFKGLSTNGLKKKTLLVSRCSLVEWSSRTVWGVRSLWTRMSWRVWQEVLPSGVNGVKMRYFNTLSTVCTWVCSLYLSRRYNKFE